MTQDRLVSRSRVTVTNAYGLHLRPAEKFVGLASKYSSDIRVYHKGHAFNGKSILDLITLAAECGTSLEVEASGPDAESAVAALVELVAARFYEPDPYGADNSLPGVTPPLPSRAAESREPS